MNLRDALLAGSEHGTDRLSVDADRRLRRRLGLESAVSPRRVWVWPALGAFAAAAVLVVVLLQKKGPNESTRGATTTAAFVDVSKQRWDGIVTAGTLEVYATSPTSATVTWLDTSITAAPGTKLARMDDGLVMVNGEIQIQRGNVKQPMVVNVPMGRAEFASYRARIKADVESVTFVLDDGSGHFTDTHGQDHPVTAGVPLVLPLPAVRTGSADERPVDVPSNQTKPARGRANLAPGETPPVGESSGPPSATPPIRRPDTPCTYKSDCEEGATCRKNEHGESVCMGHGAEGAACWFDNDCLSNLCVTRRCAP